MSQIFRAGIIGFGHMHINHVATQFGAHPQVRWIACADTRPLCPELRAAPYTRDWNRRNVMERQRIPRCYEDYRRMLADQQFDLMVVTCENALHAEVVEACAAAGVAVCVEKPMAATLSDALRMRKACRLAGTKMVVNWATSFSPQARKAKALLDEGIIGRILEVRLRVAHAGPLGPGTRHPGASEVAEPMTGPERGATWWHQRMAGGGVMLDFCCYGALLARWCVGESAISVLGCTANLDSPWADAEDNATAIVRFPGALAVVQGSWTTRHEGSPGGLILHGTTGTMVVDLAKGGGIRVERGGGKPPELFSPGDLPDGRADVAAEFIHHLETGEPVHPTMDVDLNVEVMAVLDAAARSAANGRWEILRPAEWSWS